MTQLQFFHDYTPWIINVVFWMAIVTPLFWLTFWPWLRNHWGRNLVSYDVCLAMSFIGYILKHDFGTPDSWVLPLTWVQFSAFSCIPLIIIWRTVTIFRRQRKLAIGQLHDEDI